MKASSSVTLAVGFIAVILVAPFFGAEPVSLSSLSDVTSVGHRLFFDLRLPRLIAVLIAGAGLAVLGGTYQTLFNNRLAEPYLLGVSNAVTLGLAGAEIVFHLPPQSGLAGAAGFLGAAIVTGVTLTLHRYRPRAELTLFGMGIQFLLSSILFLMLSFHSQSLGGGSLRWLFGQIQWMSLRQALTFVGLALPFFLGLFVGGRALDALSLGDSVARTLGVSPERARGWLLFISSGFVALIVSFTGAIGFVGLVIPHAARLIFRPANSRQLFALSALMGGAFLAVSDVLSRVLLPPMEFPIGIITTVIGGPVFLYLLGRRQK